MHITFASFKDAAVLLGSLVSALTVIAGAVLALIRPMRKKAAGWVKTAAQTEQLSEAVRSLRQAQEEFRILMAGQNEPLEQLKRAQLCLLRNEITKVYFFYLSMQELPAYERQNMIRMNEAYIQLEGNSYVSLIVSDMLSWPVTDSGAG